LQNFFVARTADSKTAEFLIELLGDQWVKRTNISTSDGGSGKSSSESLKEQKESPFIVSDIKNLPDRCGFFKLAGIDLVARILNTPFPVPPHKVPAFVQNERWRLVVGSRSADPRPAAASEADGQEPQIQVGEVL
jgi:hypothetical protein